MVNNKHPGPAILECVRMLGRLQQCVHANRNRTNFHHGKICNRPFRTIQRQNSNILAHAHIQPLERITQLVHLVRYLLKCKLPLRSA